MCCRVSYAWHHDYPKIARESGFCFLEPGNSGPIDWNAIGALDVDCIYRNLDFLSLEGAMSHVIEGPLSAMLDAKVLDPCIAKLFRVAQLSLQYLLFCKQFLDRSVTVLRENLADLKEENYNLKKQSKHKDEQIYKLRKKCTSPASSRRTQFMNTAVMPSCHVCGKTFLNSTYLQSHLMRRHVKEQAAQKLQEAEPTLQKPNSERDQQLMETIKLQLEIKQLKERLCNAEKQIVQRDVEISKSPFVDITEVSSKRFCTDRATNTNLLEQENAKLTIDAYTDYEHKNNTFGKKDALKNSSTNTDFKFESTDKSKLELQQPALAELKPSEKDFFKKQIDDLKDQLSRNIESVKNQTGWMEVSRKMDEQDSLWKTRCNDLEVKLEVDRERLNKAVQDVLIYRQQLEYYAKTEKITKENQTKTEKSSKYHQKKEMHHQKEIYQKNAGSACDSNNIFHAKPSDIDEKYKESSSEEQPQKSFRKKRNVRIKNADESDKVVNINDSIKSKDELTGVADVNDLIKSKDAITTLQLPKHKLNKDLPENINVLNIESISDDIDITPTRLSQKYQENPPSEPIVISSRGGGSNSVKSTDRDKVFRFDEEIASQVKAPPDFHQTDLVQDFNMVSESFSTSEGKNIVQISTNKSEDKELVKSHITRPFSVKKSQSAIELYKSNEQSMYDVESSDKDDEDNSVDEEQDTVDEEEQSIEEVQEEEDKLHEMKIHLRPSPRVKQSKSSLQLRSVRSLRQALDENPEELSAYRNFMIENLENKLWSLNIDPKTKLLHYQGFNKALRTLQQERQDRTKKYNEYAENYNQIRSTHEKKLNMITMQHIKESKSKESTTKTPVVLKNILGVKSHKETESSRVSPIKILRKYSPSGQTKSNFIKSAFKNVKTKSLDMLSLNSSLHKQSSVESLNQVEKYNKREDGSQQNIKVVTRKGEQSSHFHQDDWETKTQSKSSINTSNESDSEDSDNVLSIDISKRKVSKSLEKLIQSPIFKPEPYVFNSKIQDGGFITSSAQITQRISSDITTESEPSNPPQTSKLQPKKDVTKQSLMASPIQKVSISSVEEIATPTRTQTRLLDVGNEISDKEVKVLYLRGKTNYIESVDKKRVFFNLDANTHKTLSGTQSRESPNLQNIEDHSDFEIPSIEESPVVSTSNALQPAPSYESIVLSTRKSPKIAELSSLVESKVRQVSQLGAVDSKIVIGAVKKQQFNKKNGINVESSTTVNSSIFDLSKDSDIDLPKNTYTPVGRKENKVTTKTPVPLPRSSFSQGKDILDDLSLSDFSF